MNSNTSVPVTGTSRVFYTGAALLMLLLTLVGFSKFYFQGMAYPGREIPPPIKTLVISHGLSMTAWLLLLLVQPILILRRNVRLHMTLGKIGALLTMLILGLGIALAIQSARYTPAEARIWGMTPKQFMAVPFISVIVFAVFVAIGVVYRRNAEIHRPMMLLATLTAMSASVGRIDALTALYAGTVWERQFSTFFMTLLIGTVLWTVRCILTRSIDRFFAIGLGALIVIDWGIVQLAPTNTWDSFASIFVK